MMNSPFTLLIACFLLLGAVAVVWAIRNTANGSEDEGGFHPEPSGKTAKPEGWTVEQMEG